MLDHERNDLVIRELALTQTQLSIYRLAGAQYIARRQLHLAEQLRQLLPGQWLEVVVDLLKRDATLPEQLVYFTTFRSSWLFVNYNFVFHWLDPRELCALYLVLRT
jgi:hypothetical protein